MNQQRPTPPPQTRRRSSLEAVLLDPDASWSEIREAMKSQSRGCTNNAILGAIASGRGVTIVHQVPDNNSNDKEKPTDSDVGCAAEAPSLNREDNDENNETTSCEQNNAEYGEDVIETVKIPLKDLSSDIDSQGQGDDLTNSRNRRPSRRAMRRGSHRGSKSRWLSRSGNGFNASLASLRGSQCSAAGSVNMMDFGVDNDLGMTTLNETSSFDDGMLSRRGSMNSNHSTSLNSSSGFIGWNHNEGESLRSSVRSNFSDLVDSDGFLGWDRKYSHPTQSPLSSSEPVDKVIERFASGVGGRTCQLRNSIVPSFASNEPKAQDWNIEDYENPNDNVEKSGSRRGSFYSNYLRRIHSCTDQNSTTATKTNNAQHQKEEINMQDVKEGLFRVANSVGNESSSLPGSRRASLEEKLSDAASINQKMPKEASKSRRRMTIMEMPNFLRGTIDPNAINDDVKSGGYTSSDDALHENLFSDGSENQRPTRRHRSTFPDIRPHLELRTLSTTTGLSLFTPSEKLEGNSSRNMWNTAHKNNCSGDLREAIWINRKDGDVDIKKERRKLYQPAAAELSREDSDNCPRRASLLGLERPRFATKTETTSID